MLWCAQTVPGRQKAPKLLPCPPGTLSPRAPVCRFFKSMWLSPFLRPLCDQFLGLLFFFKKKKNPIPKSQGFQIALGKLELNKYFIVRSKIATWLLLSIKQIEKVSMVGSREMNIIAIEDICGYGSFTLRVISKAQPPKMYPRRTCQYQHFIQTNCEAWSQKQSLHF